MYSTKYIRSILPILVNAVFFAVFYFFARTYIGAAWVEYLVIGLFFVTIIPFVLVVVEYEVYTQWEETFLKFWKTQHFKKETKRRTMLFGLIPMSTEESIRVEQTIKQPPVDVILRDLLDNTELLIPVFNTASRLLSGRRP